MFCNETMSIGDDIYMIPTIYQMFFNETMSIGDDI